MNEYFYKDARSDNVVSMQFLSEKGYVTKLTASQASYFAAEGLWWKRALEISECDFEMMAELHAARKGRRRQKDPTARYLTIFSSEIWPLAPDSTWASTAEFASEDHPALGRNAQPTRAIPHRSAPAPFVVQT